MIKYEYANRVKNLQGDAIEAILKYSSMPGYIPFSAGNPSIESFPIDEIKGISSSILEKNPEVILQYTVTDGYEPFRNYLKDYLAETHNIGGDSDELMVISGAQQSSDLISRTIVNEGDVVLCEEFSFVGFLNGFTSYGAKLRGVPMEKDGMDMEALENILNEEKNVKMIYTIPNFQNPTGITMPLEKRRKLYNLALKHNVIILEDNPYGDLRYSGNSVPDIKSFDEAGAVVYVGSCSKVIAPGLRTGYALGPKEIIAKMIECKQTADVNTSLWAQQVCYEYMSKHDYSGHLKQICDLYASKKNILFEAFEKYLKGKITWSQVDGGIFAWCILPEGIDMNHFCRDLLLKEKVCVVPGDVFATEPGTPCNGFRVNFSTPTDEQIVEGVIRMSRLL